MTEFGDCTHGKLAVVVGLALLAGECVTGYCFGDRDCTPPWVCSVDPVTTAQTDALRAAALE